MSLWEVNEAARAVAEAAHPDANIIFGAMIDESVVDQVWVTVVATGYGDRPLMNAAAGREPARVAAREADHEPRVSRGPARESSILGDLDVPEFVPKR
jgi:cell division protein FtsZ